MIDKYVVVELSGNDLCVATYDDIEEAREHAADTDNKCVIVKAEHLCMDGFPQASVEVEYHT